MAASSADSVHQLREWRDHLDALVADDENAEVPPKDQSAIESAIALGISVLAGETAPPDGGKAEMRSILARDLRITTDLVLRALEAHDADPA